MNEDAKKKLIQAYKKEKRSDIKTRIHTVILVKINKLTIAEIAKIYRCDPRSVTEWIRRYDENKLVGLEGKPRSGRPPNVKLEKIKKIVANTNNITTLKKNSKATYRKNSK